LRNGSLVKTRNFKKFTYVGDPSNTAVIFNELEVDEMIILDVLCSVERISPNYKLLKDIAEECFMPLTYGGGIRNIEDADRIFDLGYEKIAVNSILYDNPRIVEAMAKKYGTQAIIASVDYKKNIFARNEVAFISGKQKISTTPIEFCKDLELLGAGEILLTSIDREGTWLGLDKKIITEVSSGVNIPVIANGGCKSLVEANDVLNSCGASAIGLGNLVVFHKPQNGVLINFPIGETD
jgi:cyclase